MAIQDDIQQFGKAYSVAGASSLGFEQTLDLLQSTPTDPHVGCLSADWCWQERAAEFVHLLLESGLLKVGSGNLPCGRYHLSSLLSNFWLIYRSKGSLKHSVLLP